MFSFRHCIEYWLLLHLSFNLAYLSFVYRLRIRPKILRGLSTIDMTTTVLGEKINFPICLAPTAMQRMADPEGELATARGILACIIIETEKSNFQFWSLLYCFICHCNWQYVIQRHRHTHVPLNQFVLLSTI